MNIFKTKSYALFLASLFIFSGRATAQLNNVKITYNVRTGPYDCSLITFYTTASGGSGNYRYDYYDSSPWNTKDKVTAGPIYTPELNKQPTKATLYEVYVEDLLDGTIKKGSVMVYPGLRGELNVFITQGFSPNGDGINDYFQVTDSGKNPRDPKYPLYAYMYHVEIFDRNGSKIYGKSYSTTNSSDPNEKNVGLYSRTDLWDGKRNGQLMPPATYYYVLTFYSCRHPDGKSFNGNVTLLR